MNEERDQIQARSPLNHVEKIRAPVFLAYGGKDPRVHLSQGKRLASELKKHKKKFEMIVEEQESHGFHIEKNRIELYRKIDEFLKKNL
jgi:dipeptidyl aminopeptidase/acylaminoacyl peptidase